MCAATSSMKHSWANVFCSRSGARSGPVKNGDLIAATQGSDSASLAFNALTAAREQQRDVLLIDTAGRLQNKAELMNELEKVVRVIKKVDASAPHAVLLARCDVYRHLWTQQSGHFA